MGKFIMMEQRVMVLTHSQFQIVNIPKQHRVMNVMDLDIFNIVLIKTKIRFGMKIMWVVKKSMKELAIACIKDNPNNKKYLNESNS
jgi:hypothetical protein